MAGDRSKLVMARRIAVATLSIVIGWPMCGAAAEGGMDPVARAALFVAGCGVLVLGLRPHIGVGLLLAALAVLGAAKPDVLEHFTAWTATFAVLGTLGFGLLLGLRSKHSLLLMSLPWWGLGDAAGWAVYVAFVFTFAWMASLLQPLLSGHGPKVNCVVGPDPRLARGPLVEVPQREFGFDRGRREIRVLLIITTIGCAVGTVVWIAVGEPVGPAITIPSASFAVAFWASELSSRGMRFRVDEKGVHARFFLRRTSIRWSEIGEIVTAPQKIATQYNVVTWKYFCILGGGRQIAFPERMVGADELAGIVAAATGMSWHDAANEADQSPSEPRIGE